jgi:hypothetical protein
VPRGDDEGHALVPIEAAERGQRPSLDLDDGDAQRRGVEHELVQRGATLRDDEQADRLAMRGEGLLDRSSAGDDLLVGTEELRSLRPRLRGPEALLGWPPGTLPGPRRPWSPRSGAIPGTTLRARSTR